MAFYYVFPVLVLFLYERSAAPVPAWCTVGLVGAAAAQLLLVGGLRVRALAESARAAAPPPPAAPDGRPGQLRRLQRQQSVLLLVFLAAWFVEVHVFRLPDLFDVGRRAAAAALLDVLLLVPFYALVLLTRWAAFPAVRTLRAVPAGMGEYLRYHLRAMAVFALPPLAYVLFYRWVLLRSPAFVRAVQDNPGLLLVAAALLVLVMLAAAPALVRHLFPREALDRHLVRRGWPDEQRRRLHARFAALAAGAGARLGPVLVWRTGGLRIANAAVTGLVARYQHIFVSDALLDQLDEAELLAVIAHELGHVRLRHPLLNYLLALSAVGLVSLALALIGPTLDAHEDSALLLPLAVLALNTVYLMTILRFALNRFERQADALAAEAMGGVGPFVAALHRLVALNVASPRQGSVTHPSAERRIAALAALGDATVRTAWLARERRRNGALAGLALAVVGAAAVVLQGLSP